MPGLSSPRPAGRCLAVEAQAHRVRRRVGAWLSCFARPPSRRLAASFVKERCSPSPSDFVAVRLPLEAMP